MSIRVMTAVWAIDLPDSQKIVLLALADCANDEGLCWPSMASLAKKCSKGERTVQGVIKELVAGGHLTRTEVAGKGCKYIVHPRSDCAPQNLRPRKDCARPPQTLRDTPAAAAPKPSYNHQEPSKDANASKARVAAKPRKVPMTSDWQPTDLSGDVGEMLAQWPPGKLESELADFREYWLEDGTKRPGWDRTFRSRIRTIHDRVMKESRNAPANQNRRSPAKSGIASALDRRLGLDDTAGALGRRDVSLGPRNSPLALTGPDTV